MPNIPTTSLSLAEARVDAGLLRYKRLRQWVDDALTLIFPPRCAGCGRVDTVWCARCQREIDLVPFVHKANRFDSLTAWAATGVHEAVLQNAVQALKYERALGVAEPLGQRLAHCAVDLAWAFDLIVPVPLHEERRRSRGYNQAELMAIVMGRILHVPCHPHALRRIRNTRSQVGLDQTQRLENVADAFVAQEEGLRDLRVLLVDDVFTTGATMDACARAARATGAKAVYALTVTTARA